MIALKAKEISKRFKLVAALSGEEPSFPFCLDKCEINGVRQSGAATAAASLLPGGNLAASTLVDVPILVTEMHFQKKQLGIDDEFLSHQASVIGWNVEELIQQVN